MNQDTCVEIMIECISSFISYITQETIRQLCTRILEEEVRKKRLGVILASFSGKDRDCKRRKSPTSKKLKWKIGVKTERKLLVYGGSQTRGPNLLKQPHYPSATTVASLFLYFITYQLILQFELAHRSEFCSTRRLGSQTTKFDQGKQNRS